MPGVKGVVAGVTGVPGVTDGVIMPGFKGVVAGVTGVPGVTDGVIMPGVKGVVAGETLGVTVVVGGVPARGVADISASEINNV